MLFHVTHTHTWESCPYNDPEKARSTFGAALGGIAESGAELVGAWVDAPAHKVFLVIDADTVEQVEVAMAPVIDMTGLSRDPIGQQRLGSPLGSMLIFQMILRAGHGSSCQFHPPISRIPYSRGTTPLSG